ncbi:MAG: hypothetical protein ABR974_11525 [Bacteroidales bacterium]|jgi:long-subunit fatty acid transport protein
MRKLLTSVFAALLTGTLFAAGLVTNTNQSAAWVRLPARNASTDIDAAYYNPAGMTKLEDGFHFSLSNQTIFQTKTVVNNYKGPGGFYGLNDPKYIGDIKAPVFPGIYAVYKKNRLAFSLGFNPVGGGGGATYKTGLPSFEMSPSDLVPALASQGAEGYKLDAYLKGTSVYFGLQGGIAYKINDKLSLGVGLRYVMAKNTYSGHLTDIELNMGGTWIRADQIMTGIATQAKGGGDALNPLITGGLGGLTPAQAAGAGYISPVVAATITGGLTQLGVPNASSLTIAQSQAAYYGAEAKYTATATLLGDQSVDVTQNGSGISPIFSVNISPTENVNFAVRYEMRTKMDVTNKTKSDFLLGFTATGTPITMFPNGEKTPSDMPALLAAGIDFKVAPKVKISLGADYFFDKQANYGHKLDLVPSAPATFVANSQIIDQNGYDLCGGLEWKLSDKLLVSAGYLWANKGVNSLYQSDLTYANATSTYGFGGAYSVMKNLKITLGGSITTYVLDETYVDHIFAATNTLYTPLETHTKTTWMFAIGVDYSF